MTKVMFSGPTAVEFQGAEILTLNSNSPDHVEFQVIGFYKPKISVVDYRLSSIEAVNHFLETSQDDQFPSRFNVPADAFITKRWNGDIQIVLRECYSSEPLYMLWAAIGIHDTIPIYDYLFYHFTPLSDNLYAFISLYERPYLANQPLPQRIFSNLAR